MIEQYSMMRPIQSFVLSLPVLEIHLALPLILKNFQTIVQNCEKNFKIFIPLISCYFVLNTPVADYFTSFFSLNQSLATTLIYKLSQ